MNLSTITRGKQRGLQEALLKKMHHLLCFMRPNSCYLACATGLLRLVPPLTWLRPAASAPVLCSGCRGGIHCVLDGALREANRSQPNVHLPLPGRPQDHASTELHGGCCRPSEGLSKLCCQAGVTVLVSDWQGNQQQGK